MRRSKGYRVRWRNRDAGEKKRGGHFTLGSKDSVVADYDFVEKEKAYGDVQ